MNFANHTWLEYFAGAVVFQYARYLVLCGGLYYVFWVALKARTEKRRVYPAEFVRSDLWREVRDSFWFCVITSVPIAFALVPEYRAYTKIYFDIHEHSMAWIPASFVLLLFGQDAYFYWVHRLMHTRWIFTHVHSVHHKSLNPSPLTAFAMHPAEGLLLFGYIFTFVWVVPTHFYVFIAFQMISMALNINGHFGAEFQPEVWKKIPFLKNLNRSTYHTGHHRFFTVNYGLYFTFWDRWMKTFREKIGK
jgi:sterol desaturase/sphingolipid hydroxylase (fatty acid hydroxylase superfamily)